jgi:biopolymer transport protein ExbB
MESLQQNYLVKEFILGGPVMYPLLLCSILSVTFILERLWTMLRVPSGEKLEAYLEEVEGVLKKQGEKAVVDRLAKGRGPLNYVFAALVKRYDTLVLEEREFEDMRRELISTCEDAAMGYLGRFLPVLATIGAVSTLLGLTGTITGMIRAFTSIAQSGVGDPTVVARGISEALITTAAGLFIAIPTVVFYRYLVSRADKALDRLEMYTHAFGNTLLLLHREQKATA